MRSLILREWGLLVLIALTAALGVRGVSGEGFAWPNAARHAMNGVMVRDLLVDGTGGRSLQLWTDEYRLRYPTVGIGREDLPGFAVVMGLVMAVIDVSSTTAGFVVLATAGLSSVLLWVIARRLFGNGPGLAGAVLMLSATVGVSFAAQVSPAWLVLYWILFALLGYLNYLRRPGWGAGVMIGFGCLAACLTRLDGCFVLLLIASHAWWNGRLKPLKRMSFVLPVALAIVTIIPFVAWYGRPDTLAVDLLFGSPALQHLAKVESWWWYLMPGRLAGALGVPLAVGFGLAVAILLTRAIRSYVRLFGSVVGRSEQPSHDGNSCAGDDEDEPKPAHRLALPGVWLFLAWIALSMLVRKQEGYLFIASPAICLLTVAALQSLNGRRRFGMGTAALGVLCVIQVAAGWRTPVHRPATTEATVEYLVSEPNAGVVLVDALRSGQFVYDLRTHPTLPGRITPLLASRHLYQRFERPRSTRSTVHTVEELHAWLVRNRVDHVVIEDRLPASADRTWDAPPRVLLRQTIDSDPRFEPVHRQSLAGDAPAWQDVSLVTYRYEPQAPPAIGPSDH